MDRNFLVIDIETVSQHATYEAMPETWQGLFDQKERYTMAAQSLTAEECYERKGGILAEFGKVIVIGMGVLQVKEQKAVSLRVKMLSGEDEQALLAEFSQVLTSFSPNKDRPILCGHNIREFDIPYLCRRMVVCNLPIPPLINLQDRRPWEATERVHDTFQLWRFGDYKHFTSLELLCACLGVPSSKEGISGEQVHALYHKKKALSDIATYCQGDVVAVAQVYLRLKGYALLEEISIKHVV